MQLTVSSLPFGGRQTNFAQVAELCDQAQTGSALAESRVLGLIGPRLKRMLERIVWDKDAIEDILQDTLELALLKLRAGAVRHPEHFYAFACGIGRNLLIKHIRRGQRLAGQISIDDVAESVLAKDTSSDPLDRLVQAESAGTVLAQISKLPRARDRRVLIAHYFLDHSARSLSRELGLKEAHFYRVLYRARKRLQKLLLNASLD